MTEPDERTAEEILSEAIELADALEHDRTIDGSSIITNWVVIAERKTLDGHTEGGLWVSDGGHFTGLGLLAFAEHVMNFHGTPDPPPED